MSASQKATQMMDEYAGPIGLYAYLAHRSKVAPVMLRRNLSYCRDAYEAERRRMNSDGRPAAGSAKPDRADAAQDDGKDRAAERAPEGGGEGPGGDGAGDGARADAAAHGAGAGAGAGAGGAAGAGGKRAQDGEQPCSRRSIHAAKRTAVVFRLRYQEGQQESVHRAPEMRCPWCEMSCGELESLMWHLQASHDRFSYALDKSLAIPEIYINVKVSSATEELHKSLSPHANFCFLSARRGGGSLSASLLQLLACEDDAADGRHDGSSSASKKRKKDKEGSSSGAKAEQAGGAQGKAFKKKAGKPKKGARPAVEKKTLAQRHLFRSQTCLPIDVNDEMDMDYDSDDDVDDEWQLAQVMMIMIMIMIMKMIITTIRIIMRIIIRITWTTTAMMTSMISRSSPRSCVCACVRAYACVRMRTHAYACVCVRAFRAHTHTHRRNG